LTFTRYKRKNFTEVQINIVVHSGEVTSLAGKWVGRMKKNKGCFGVQFDDGLQVGRRRTGEVNIVVA
jgi:hypothetical protein